MRALTVSNELIRVAVFYHRRAEEFLETFTCAYSLEEVRVGSILPKESMMESAFGAVVRLLYVYGVGWHIYVMQGRN